MVLFLMADFLDALLSILQICNQIEKAKAHEQLMVYFLLHTPEMPEAQISGHLSDLVYSMI